MFALVIMNKLTISLSKDTLLLKRHGSKGK